MTDRGYSLAPHGPGRWRVRIYGRVRAGLAGFVMRGIQHQAVTDVNTQTSLSPGRGGNAKGAPPQPGRGQEGARRPHGHYAAGRSVERSTSGSRLSAREYDPHALH